MRSGIVYATMIIVLVFVPLFALSGHRGPAVRAARHRLHRLDPRVAGDLDHRDAGPGLLPAAGTQPRATSGDSFVVRHLKRGNAALLRWAFAHRAGGVRRRSPLRSSSPACAAVLLPRSFLPPFNEGTLLVSVQYNPGISLAESHRLGFIAEQLVAQVPEVRSVGRRTGRAELDEHAEGVHVSELDVDLDALARAARTRSTPTSARGSSVLPASINIGQPISHRLDHMLSGVRAQIALKIFGEDLDTLRRLAETLRERLAGDRRAWSTCRSRSRS